MPPKTSYVRSCIHSIVSTYIAAKPLPLHSSLKCCSSEFRCFEYSMVILAPSNDVAAIPDEASVSAILLCEQIVAKINGFKKVFPVSPRVSKKQIPSVSSFTTFLIVWME